MHESWVENWLVWGEILMDSGDLEGAATKFARAAELDPADKVAPRKINTLNELKGLEKSFDKMRDVAVERISARSSEEDPEVEAEAKTALKNKCRCAIF